MNLALDTNAFRALDEGNTKLGQLVKAATSLGLPLTVLGEIYFGVFYGVKQEQNTTVLNRFLLSPRVEVLHPDQDTARVFGHIAAELKKSGQPIQQNDIWIAALCKQHGYALATSDKDFTRITGLETISF